jgi:PAS domain S-box-containing protein
MTRTAIIFSILLIFYGRPAPAAESNAKNVLVMFGSLQSEPVLEVIESSVRAHVPNQVNFSVAYLDFQRLEQEPYRKSLAETIRRGYNGMNPDVLIVASIHSLQFVMEYRNEMFPGVPIVFTEVSAGELEGQKMQAGMTGLVASLGLRETIDLALRLHPDANAVAILADTPGDPERYWVARTHSELLRYRDKLKEIDVIGPPSQEMLSRVAELPLHTIVLFELAPQSSSDPAIGVDDVLKVTAERLPTYSPLHTLCLKYGCVGGAYSDWQKQIRLTGEMAARVLSGERPESIPVIEDSNFQVQVDWRALQHWHISESALPAGSVILYRPPSLWQSYRKYVIAVTVVIAILLLLIVGLLWERLRKRKVEAALRESEKRFRVMADTTPSLVWMCDPKGKITYLNERSTAFTGSDSAAGYGDSWTACVHPDDLRNVKDGMSQGQKDHRSFSREYRLRRSDGVYRWMFDVASPRVNGDGSFGGFIGSAIDVTEQKLAQQALEQVSGQLIEAQEKERSRIARDLHDDICQRLALLSMEIEQTNRGTDGPPAATKRSLEEIRKQCSEIADDVQSLSHQLHSSKLEYLGVVAAIRGFCSEFSRQHEVSIAFIEKKVPRHLPKDISLCLFRVTQEALHNATKYSGVSQFAVELTATPDDIQLVVSDSGAGFDVEEAKKNRGLGLVSMQERVHLVHGTLAINSTPGKGTTILAAMPLPADSRGPSEDRMVEENASITGIP